MVHKRGKGVKNVKKMSTWFMTQTIAFRDVTVKFFDMGLRLDCGNFLLTEIMNGMNIEYIMNIYWRTRNLEEANVILRKFGPISE